MTRATCRTTVPLHRARSKPDVHLGHEVVTATVVTIAPRNDGVASYAARTLAAGRRHIAQLAVSSMRTEMLTLR